jgi:hypothetical protein
MAVRLAAPKIGGVGRRTQKVSESGMLLTFYIQRVLMSTLVQQGMVIGPVASMRMWIRTRALVYGAVLAVAVVPNRMRLCFKVVYQLDLCYGVVGKLLLRSHLSCLLTDEYSYGVKMLKE